MVMTSTMNAVIVSVAKNGKFWNDHLYSILANIDVHAAVMISPTTKKTNDQIWCSRRIESQPYIIML